MSLTGIINKSNVYYFHTLKTVGTKKAARQAAFSL